MARFKTSSSSRAQQWLFAQSLDDLVPAECDVRLFNEAMDCLDWRVLEESYASTGRPAYDPRVICKALCYAYAQGIRSSRQIERLMRYDVRYMWLAGGLKPDYRTLARFRRDKHTELKTMFAGSVRLCCRMKLVSLETVAVDGTKVRAGASTRSLYDSKRLTRELELAEQALREAEAVDAEEDAQARPSAAGRLPKHLKDPAKRLERLKALRKELEDSGAKAVSATDAECRMMKTTAGVKPCFNVQAVVDSSSQVIVAVATVHKEVDHGLLPEMLEQAEDNTGLRADMVLADGGYSDERALTYLQDKRQDALIPPGNGGGESRSKREARFAAVNFQYDEQRDVYVCPEGKVLSFRRLSKTPRNGEYRVFVANGCQGCCSYRACVPDGRGSRKIKVGPLEHLRRAMRERLSTDEGKQRYKRRAAIVEPVNGQLKHNRQFARLLLGGLAGAGSEVYLMTLAHNVMKTVQAVQSSVFCSLPWPLGAFSQLHSGLADFLASARRVGQIDTLALQGL